LKERQKERTNQNVLFIFLSIIKSEETSEKFYTAFIQQKIILCKAVNITELNSVIKIDKYLDFNSIRFHTFATNFCRPFFSQNTKG
jgi:hypothetical protein